MSTFNVSNATELKSAIANAVGGDRIVLADGDYGNVNIFSRNFASTVTIEAATPGTGAHLDGLFVAGSKNLNFVGLDIGRALNAGEPTYTQLSWIKSSSNVTLDGVHIHGSLDGNPANDGVGLTVTSVTDFEVTNSKFEDLYRGLVLQKSSNATITNNEITMIRSDGIISAANDDLLIQGNHIGEFRPNVGDHADAIQFWNTGQTKGQSNITIKDNEIFQSYFGGKEGTGIQGIFMSDPLTYGYQNVLIENNLLYSNDAYNGIYVNGATDVQLLGNTVVSKSTDSKLFWIKLQDSSHIALHDNVTDRVITQNVTDFTQSGNVDFTANSAARAHFPNLTNPTGVDDLVAPGVGYHIPFASPESVVTPAPAPTPAPSPSIAPASTIYGSEANDTLVGGDGADTLVGLGGADVLIGGASVNTLQGGAGDDIYFVSTQGDTIVELANEGRDQVRTTVSRLTLATETEMLVYTGSGDFNGIGNDGANVIVGGDGPNVLDGRLGSDTLIGGAAADILIGGSGAANTLQGGNGNDTYFIDVRGDSIVELAGQGQDQVRTSLAYYVLPKQVESLVYTGTEFFNGVGNDDANIVQGGGGNDLLNGAGGDDILLGGDGRDILVGGGGANTMQGGAGDDVYFVSSAQDSVFELPSQGIDQIRTDLARYTLSNQIEQLVYVGQGAFNGIGNELDNLLTGGASNDTLTGLAGNDSLIGNDGNDLLYGGDGADLLNGGTGADILVGGSGPDQFLFGALLGAADTIRDMEEADHILLDSKVFSTLPVGVLDQAAFSIGPTAQDSDDRIIYDPAKGVLMYDADGRGAGAAHVFATLPTDLHLTATNFLII